MKVAKKFYFIVFWALFLPCYIFSLNDSAQDPYKKEFVVDRTKNDIAKYITKDEKDDSVVHCFFPPRHDARGLLCGLLKKEQEKVLVTIYALHDKEIAATILETVKRGIKVEIAFDSKFEKQRYEKKVTDLEKLGAKVFIYRRPPKRPHEHVTGIMHDKYVIFYNTLYGKKLLWTGSYNFTSAANDRNQENVIIDDCSLAIEDFEIDFERLKTVYCYPYISNSDSDYVEAKDPIKSKKEGLLKEKPSKKRKREIFEAVDFEPKKKKRKIDPTLIAKTVTTQMVLRYQTKLNNA